MQGIRNTLIVGTVLAAGSFGSVAVANGGAVRATASDGRGEHRRECFAERRANPRDFRKDHGTIRQCIKDEHRKDVREDRYDD